MDLMEPERERDDVHGHMSGCCELMVWKNVLDNDAARFEAKAILACSRFQLGKT
jgi:hypothetical protein